MDSSLETRTATGGEHTGRCVQLGAIAQIAQISSIGVPSCWNK
jgi:hypothetical protein